MMSTRRREDNLEMATYLAIMKEDPMTRQAYRLSFHGSPRLLNGGGVRGGNRAFRMNQEGNMRIAFMPAMISIASRKSLITRSAQ